MTGLLEKALSVWNLPDKEQDAIASPILESLDDEAAWERTFSGNQDRFRTLAQEALNEHRRGETRPIEELLGD